jgi:RNA polymerase sigma-70 factor (ECF subfamily)
MVLAMDRTESSVLLREARHGSPEAIGMLFDECGAPLLAYIRLRLGQQLRGEMESRDILQNTFLRGLQHFEQFEGSESSTLRGWLVAIAANEIRDQRAFIRRRRRDARRRVRLTPEDEPVATTVHSEVSRIDLAEQASRLETVMERLSPEHREAILLRQYEELSFGEIGERMGRSTDAARMLFARAMAKLSVEMRRSRQASPSGEPAADRGSDTGA